MNLTSLALSNIRKSMKDFTIYFATLILGVAVFYVFNGLSEVSQNLDLTSSQKTMIEYLDYAMNYISVFVSIVLGFLIIYATNFLMKRRKKEFGLYMLLGMSKRNVSRILVIETMLIGLISLIVGILLGVVVSQFMSLIVANMFKADVTKYTFNFSTASAIKTLIYFTIIYVVVIIFNAAVIAKCKLIDLIYASKKGEIVPIKNPIISVILFAVSIFILISAYNIVNTGGRSLHLEEVGIAMLLGCLGTAILVYSFSGLMMLICSVRKSFYYKNLNFFVVRQLRSKFNTTVASMSLIAIMMFMTIAILSNGIAISRNFNTGIEKYNNADYTVYADSTSLKEHNFSKISEYLKTKNFDLIGNSKNIAEYNAYYVDGVTSKTVLGKKILKDYGYAKEIYDRNYPVMTLSQYNMAAKILKSKQLKLNDDQFVFAANEIDMIKQINKRLDEKFTLDIGGSKLSSKYNKVQDLFYSIDEGPYNPGFIIIPDAVAEKENKTVIRTFASGNYKEGVDAVKLEAKFDKIGNNTDGKGVFLVTNYKDEMQLRGYGAGTIITFIGIYLASIFLITSAAILALKQLTEVSDDKQEYQLLRYIGTDESMINTILFRQIACFFLLPISIAIIHVIGALPFTTRIVDTLGNGQGVGVSALITAAIIILIYGGYFIITYFTSKKLVREK